VHSGKGGENVNTKLILRSSSRVNVFISLEIKPMQRVYTNYHPITT